MVGRFVQQQRLRLAEERLCEQHADALVARDLAHLAVVPLVGNIEPLKQDCRVALGRISVFLADDPLELTKADAIRIGQIRLRVQQLTLLKRRPQPRVAHHDHVDDTISVERKLVLTDEADLLGPDDGALLRVELAREHLHEGGLAGSIGSGEAIAAAR